MKFVKILNLIWLNPTYFYLNTVIISLLIDSRDKIIINDDQIGNRLLMNRRWFRLAEEEECLVVFNSTVFIQINFQAFYLVLDSYDSISHKLFLFFQPFNSGLPFISPFELRSELITQIFCLDFKLGNRIRSLIHALNSFQELLFALVDGFGRILKGVAVFRKFFCFKIQGQFFVKVDFLLCWVFLVEVCYFWNLAFQLLEFENELFFLFLDTFVFL